ncbi:hypothetical protein Tco_1338081 [Tanacetum coccineum]
MTNDKDEESKDAFIHTPKDYVPTDDETKDVDEEEYERISKELYGDVNVKLTDAEHNDEEKGDAYMTDAAHVQVEQTQEQTTGVHEESGPEMASIQGHHFVSSTYTNAFLNLENLHSTEMKVVSMLDINVQHEVPCTSPLLTIPVSVIPKHTIFHPSETVINALATTITSLLSSLFPTLQQSIPILTLTNTEATTSTFVVPLSETLSTLHQRIINLENDVKELKSVDKSTTKHSADIIKEHSVPAEIVERLKQQYAPQKKSILKDEDAMDKGVAHELKKRKPDDVDKDEGPTSAKHHVKEPIFVQDFNYAKHDDTEFDNIDMPMDQGEVLGKTDEQPNNEVVPNNDCWLNDLVKATRPPLTFDELMHTPIDFFAFEMNHLRIDNLTKEHIVGTVYNLLKVTCKRYVELDYTMQECYRALSE